MEAEKSKKEQIWEVLKKYKKGEMIKMLEMSKEIDCSLAYVSSMMKFSFESGFIEFNETGNYIIKNIPDWPTFQEKTAERYNTYRNTGVTKQGGRSRKTRIPSDFKFEAEKENIINVIRTLIENYNEMEERVGKLTKYAKKIKQERDELLSVIESSEFD